MGVLKENWLKTWFLPGSGNDAKVPQLMLSAKGLLLPGRHALYEFMDDFDSFTLGAANVSGWTKTETGSGTGAVVQDERYGVIKFVTGTTASDEISYQWCVNTTPLSIFQLSAGKQAWVAARFKTEDADQDSFYIGANIADTSPFASEPTDQFRFRSGATPDALQFAVGKTASTEVTIGLGNLADGTYVRVLAWYDGADTVWAYRFDDSGNLTNSGSVSVTTSAQGDLLPDTFMCPAFGGDTADTGGDDFFFDFLYLAQER